MIKRVFVSDVHMSAGWSLNGQTGRYDWLDAGEANSFAQFLTSLNNDASVQEIVLLGDMMDDWVYPIDVQPADYSRIVAAPHISPVVNNLKTLSRNKKVIYVPGNHDMTIMDDRVKTFRENTFSGVIFQDRYETADGILAEHGHQYTMYNAVDRENQLPLGHYISRLAATVEARKKKRCRQSTVVATLFPPGRQAHSSQTALGDPFVNLPLSYLAGELGGVDDASRIVTIEGIGITLGEVRYMYRHLSEDWAEKHGAMDVFGSVWREAVGFWGLVQQLAVDKNKKVIILGHTHSRENCYLGTADAITGEIKDPCAIYANCGSWCNHDDPNPRPYTYVVTEYDEDKDGHTVSLMYWGEDRKPEVNVI